MSTLLADKTDSAGRRHRRYPASFVAEARRLAEAGWAVPGIANIIEKENGVRPTDDTIRSWTDEKYAEARREKFARQKRNKRRERGVSWLPQGSNLDTKLHRIAVLHDEAKLGCRAIAAVMNVDYALSLTENQVRYYLETGSVPLSMRAPA